MYKEGESSEQLGSLPCIPYGVSGEVEFEPRYLTPKLMLSIPVACIGTSRAEGLITEETVLRGKGGDGENSMFLWKFY
jgi:hypothetical protein